jgi:hypothetical protein
VNLSLLLQVEAGHDGHWKSDRAKNKKAGNTIDNVVTEVLAVPSGINKSGRKVGPIFKILCS